MNSITRISFARYKAFSEQQNLELRPVTLLFGFNSAGKSAALRALPVLAAACRARSRSTAVPSFFDYAGPAIRGASFLDLLNSSHPGGAVEFGLDWSDGSKLQFAIRNGGPSEGEFIGAYSFSNQAGNLEAQLGGDGTWSHDVIGVDELKLGMATFHGLEVDLSPETTDVFSLQSAVNQLLVDFSSSVHWLGSIRSRPPRHYFYGPGTSISISEDGTGTAEALRASYLAKDGVAQAVSAWLEKACGCHLSFLETEGQVVNGRTLYPFLLSSTTSAASVSVQDVGEGIAQALPVVTMIHQAKVGTLGDRPILAIEQPELHLHPKASVMLADEIVQCIADGSPAVHVVETHSESVLLSVQTAIVEGRLNPGEVIVYWVTEKGGSSFLMPVTFDEKGYPSDNWPSTIFREAVAQARQLNSIRSQ